MKKRKIALLGILILTGILFLIQYDFDLRNDFDTYMAPVVRFNTGSGTIIHVEKQKEEFVNYVLTNAHVIFFDKKSSQKALLVYSYDKKGFNGYKHYFYKTLFADNHQDISLVSFTTETKMYEAAKKPKISRFYKHNVFDEVTKVGCGTSLHPHPTFGKVIGTNHMDGVKMLDIGSYPSFFGDSGGAVFDKKGYYIGMPTLIRKFGGVVVPHISFFIPVGEIHKCLYSNGYGHFFEK